MPIGKINPPTPSQTGRTSAPHTADQQAKAPAEGTFKGSSSVTGVKPLDTSHVPDHPVVKNHVETAAQFHEDIRDFDELVQAGASHPERLRDASDRVVVQPNPYETPVKTQGLADYEKLATPYETPVSARPTADYDKLETPYEVPTSSKSSANHDYEDIDALRPGEVFDHLAPKLPERNDPNKLKPSAYEAPVSSKPVNDYEKPVTAYETPVSAQPPANYETPVQQGSPEPIYAEIGPGKTQAVYDRLNPPKEGGNIQGKETSV
jgi:hypothetical protein